MRLIDADALKNLPFERMIHTDFGETAIPIDEIDNAPTVDFEKIGESLNCQIRATYGSCGDCLLSCPRNELIKLLGLERPQGEWGKHGECPFCSYIRQWEDDNFCGNCGADMRKEETK